MKVASRSVMVLPGAGTLTLVSNTILAGTSGISIGDAMLIRGSLRKRGFEKQLDLKGLLIKKKRK